MTLSLQPFHSSFEGKRLELLPKIRIWWWEPRNSSTFPGRIPERPNPRIWIQGSPAPCPAPARSCFFQGKAPGGVGTTGGNLGPAWHREQQKKGVCASQGRQSSILPPPICKILKKKRFFVLDLGLFPHYLGKGQAGDTGGVLAKGDITDPDRQSQKIPKK